MFRKDVSRLLIQAKPVLDDIVECESYSAAAMELDNTTKSLVTKLKSSFLSDTSKELPHHNLHEFSEQYVRPTKEMIVEDERELILSSSPREVINWNFTPRNKNTVIERSNDLMNSIGKQKKPGPIVPSKVLGLKNVMPERRYKSELMDESIDMPVKKISKIQEKKKTLQSWPDKVDPKLTHERAQIEEVQSNTKKAGPPPLFDRGGERFASRSVSEIRESPGHYRIREYIRPKTHCMVRPFDKPDKGKHPLEKRREILAERGVESMLNHTMEVEVVEESDQVGELLHSTQPMRLDRSQQSLGAISTGATSGGKIGEGGSEGDESTEDEEGSDASVLEEMLQHRNARRSQQSMASVRMSSSTRISSFKKKEPPPRKTKAELEEEHKNRILKKLDEKEKKVKQKLQESVSRPVEAAAYGDRRAAAMYKEKRQHFLGQFRQLQGLPEKKNPFAYSEEKPTMFKARKRGYKVHGCESWKQGSIGYQPQDISLAGPIRKATKSDWKIPRSRQVVNPMSIGQQAASSIEFFWSRAQKTEG